MTLEHIRIEFRCAEGALRRTLGVVEARGFAVRSMQMGSDGDRPHPWSATTVWNGKCFVKINMANVGTD